MTGFFKRMARHMIRSQEEGLRTHKAVLRLLDRVRPVSNLLDVGCSRGAKAVIYAQSLGMPLNCVSGIEAQSCYAGEAANKFKVCTFDIEKEPFPFPDESFDLVICNQVLEHLKNIYRPLKEMDRVVKTGGWLIIGVPNLAGLYNRILLLFGRQPLSSAIDGPHVRSFAHSAFLGFLRQNPNFELAAVEAANLYPLPYPLIKLFEGRCAGLSAFTFYLFRKKTHNPDACGWKAGPAEDTCF
ncbi:MAG: hypothetical protein A2270_02235 [Elusimicrobia bacterium RIFOXYA12_FULL_51_18]|nr:MAG: hypothetical protein A2270_02235 [Elusimicrobia bacterium RIFOXYA12_FULL_51_18]OGS28336.1 MAG: hypothetical protein A2218_00085 [Elusimicrobia bacterium RIFOXYA2_FULL_53_38]